MENSLVIFGETWPKTMYYSTGFFNSIFEQHDKFVKNPISIGITSNFLHNVKTCICIRKCNKNGEFSPCDFS